MNPMKITINGGLAMAADRVELEASIRRNAEIPAEQPIEFIEIKLSDPVVLPEQFKTSRGSVDDGEEDGDEDQDEEPEPDPEPKPVRRRKMRRRKTYA